MTTPAPIKPGTQPALRAALRAAGPGRVWVGHTGFTSVPRTGGRSVTMMNLDKVPLDRVLASPGRVIPNQTGTVVVFARTATDLRRVAPLGTLLPKSLRTVICVVEHPADAAAPVPSSPGMYEWGDLHELSVTRLPGSGWLLAAHFDALIRANEVLRFVVRSVAGVGPRTFSPPPLAAFAGSAGAAWRPGDTRAVEVRAEGPVPIRRVTVKSDVALRVSDGGHPEWIDPTVPVLDREADALSAARPEALAPIDERAVNPIGFGPVPEAGMAELRVERNEWRVVRNDRYVGRLPSSGQLAGADIARLRNLRGIRLGWHEPSAGYARTVVALAAAGVPLITDPVPGWAAALLGPELTPLLTSVTEVDLADALHRDEHSVRLRRAALRRHGSHARWRQLAAEAGVPVPKPPVVSVLLCTRRPDMVGFGLRQIARQRHVDAEVVLGLHGFGADLPEVAAAVAAHPTPVTVVEQDAGTVYGAALNAAAARASGSLLAKMDDDDWYGPEHLADMALARLYSGAEVVGCRNEFVYLTELDRTVWRRNAAERPDAHVAGGSLLFDREVFGAVGGFRPLPRAVDSQFLLGTRQAGGREYRTHGLGYVLRRSADGHTWAAEDTHFLRGSTRQWRGFRPSALLEPDPADLPPAARRAQAR
ncbi:glycosyltransferase [Allonocardiopsis opalescens]|uniref:Glycosyltransferase involved in cell wall biosynthesis n=1 Tax=Allonocardiopsis opalescens TaxID=1144618 RepID=A0A2T0Q043_9ACTN|nr:glycosyltransferase [Allonocardiopsis opalescens]PRX97157.1 glycosyltransferase involved in cell wall biosynthesis [Allonocardiopsis opalescens]